MRVEKKTKVCHIKTLLEQNMIWFRKQNYDFELLKFKFSLTDSGNAKEWNLLVVEHTYSNMLTHYLCF